MSDNDYLLDRETFGTSSSKITYENQNGKRIGVKRHWDIDVRLNGKIVGQILSVATGYCYKPTKGKVGAIFPTIEALKQSLEEE